jgi:hypothetical protein
MLLLGPDLHRLQDGWQQLQHQAEAEASDGNQHAERPRDKSRGLFRSFGAAFFLATGGGTGVFLSRRHQGFAHRAVRQGCD